MEAEVHSSHAEAERQLYGADSLYFFVDSGHQNQVTRLVFCSILWAILLTPYQFETWSLTDLELASLSTVFGQQTPKILLSLLPHLRDYRRGWHHAEDLRGDGDSNSGPLLQWLYCLSHLPVILTALRTWQVESNKVSLLVTDLFQTTSSGLIDDLSNMCQNCLPWGWGTPVHPSPSPGLLTGFSIMISAITTMNVQIYLWNPPFTFSGSVSQSAIAGS